MLGESKISWSAAAIDHGVSLIERWAVISIAIVRPDTTSVRTILLFREPFTHDRISEKIAPDEYIERHLGMESE
jgi:hypothetical protein